MSSLSIVSGESPPSKKERLEKAIKESTYKFVTDPKTNEEYQHVFLHPEDCQQNYTETEKEALAKRDFKARLFFANSAIGPDSVFLQSYFSDNHAHNTNFNFVQYFFKAIVATNNLTSARVALTRILMAGFLKDESDYISFAVTMASVLSNNGQDAHFEISKMKPLKTGDPATSQDKPNNDPAAGQDVHLKTSQKQKSAAILQETNETNPDELAKFAGIRREQLCVLMDIVFSKFQTRRFLLGGGRLNVYRLGHCRSAFADGWLERLYSHVDSVFCFLLQLSLASYVVLEMVDVWKKLEEGEGVWNRSNVPLASITTFYSCIVFYADIQDTVEACSKVYHKRTLFQAMDIFVNIALHPLLLIAGFFVIVSQANFIDGVLNGVALLFIIEVDDNLYTLLNLNAATIIGSYLVKLSMMQLGMVLKEDNNKLFNVSHDENNASQQGGDSTKSSNTRSSAIDPRAGVDFGDFYLTNQQEQGTDTNGGAIFQPFKFKTKEGLGDFISPSTLITERCLIKKITWEYTHFGDDLTTNPRIGRLKIDLLKEGTDPIIINANREKFGDGVELRDEKNVLEGVFIITNFQMSTDIRRLRLCGTRRGAQEFLDACEYYSLWDLSPSAKKLLGNIISKDKNKNSKKSKEIDGGANGSQKIEPRDGTNSSTRKSLSSSAICSMDGSVVVQNAADDSAV